MSALRRAQQSEHRGFVIPNRVASARLDLRRRTLRLHPTTRVVLAVLVSGVASGVAGGLLTLLLHGVQHLAYGYHDNPFVIGVERSSPLRRILAPVVGAAVVAAAWVWLRRSPLPGVRDAVTRQPKRMPVVRTLFDAVLQIAMVGTGSSVGREGAPRQAAAVLTSSVSSVFVLPVAMRRVLIASAAGAGLAAVYNVPLSGAVFAVEVLAIGYRHHHAVIALAMSLIATYVARPVVTGDPTYSYPAHLGVPASAWAWAVLAIPVCALVGRGFAVANRWARLHRPGPTWRLPVAMVLGALAIGVLSVWLYALPGNGKGIVQLTMLGSGATLTYAALVVLKPAATALSVGTGVTGGLLTPSMATGAALGAAVAGAGGGLGLTLPLAAFGLIAAVGVLAATQDAPWFAAVMGWELAHPPLLMAVPLLAVSWGVVLLTRAMTRRRELRTSLIAMEQYYGHAGPAA